MEALLILLLIALLAALAYLVMQNTMMKVRYQTLQDTLMTLRGRSTNGSMEMPSGKLPGGGGLFLLLTMLGTAIFLFWMLFRTL